jgi:hypothetical protein
LHPARKLMKSCYAYNSNIDLADKPQYSMHGIKVSQCKLCRRLSLLHQHTSPLTYLNVSPHIYISLTKEILLDSDTEVKHTSNL